MARWPPLTPGLPALTTMRTFGSPVACPRRLREPLFGLVPMRRRDVTRSLFASAAGLGTAAPNARAETCASPCFSRTQAEIKVGVVPSQLIYTASPRVDPRRYGAIGDGTKDDTQAMQTALKVAQASNGRVTIPEDFRMLCGPLSLTVSGLDALSNSLAVEGVSMVGSRILAKPGLTSPLITLRSSNPAGLLQPAQLVLENFSLHNLNNSKMTGGHGMSLQGLGWARISGLQIVGFDAGLEMINSLSTLIDQQCQFNSNNTGLAISRLGGASAAQTANLITVDHCRIIGNSKWGVHFSGGSQFVMRGCNLEQNGERGNASSGALLTGSDLSGNFGLARIELYENWIEANYGQAVRIQALSSGLLTVSIEGGQVIASEHGQALIIGTPTSAVHQVLLKNLYSPSSADTWQINATYLTLINTLAANLKVDAAHHTYINALSSTGLLS
jgi:Right handed beta helix region